MPVVSNIKLKLLGVVMLNFYIRAVLILTASLMATHALSQDMRGWSDKTVCRLLIEDPDNTDYFQEAEWRGLDCASSKGNATKVTEENAKSDAIGSADLDGLIGSIDLKGRIGSIDLEGRMEGLSQRAFLLGTICLYSSNSGEELQVLKTLNPKAGYGGSDPRIQPISNRLLDITAACFAGSQIACHTGIASLKKYAELDAPREKAFVTRELRIANDYIMNTSFISPAINFLSVYNREIGLTESELAVFDQWLKNITKRYRKEGFYSNDRPNKIEHGHNERWAAQNHYISSNISSAALGAWLGDPILLNYGVKQWKLTLGTMRSDGSLPHETARGSRAILYSGYTITKLVRLAEIFRQQGVDLYSTEVNGKSIHDNISFYLDVMQNPEIVHKYAKYDVNSGGDISYKDQEELGIYSGHHAWIAPYMLRFPSHPNTMRLQKFSGKENKHTKNLVDVIQKGYGGTYGLDAHSRCFYSKI
jgi:hypothetical protein